MKTPATSRPPGTIELRPPTNGYDRRVVRWWRSQLLVATGMLSLPLVILGVLIAAARTWLLVPAAVIVVVGLLTALTLPLWWYKIGRASCREGVEGTWGA